MPANHCHHYDDPDIRRALSWLLSYLDPADWTARKAAIAAHIESLHEAREPPAELSPATAVTFADDRIAWYLFLAETVLTHPLSYEPIQGCRVLPIFKRLGSELDTLQGIRGLDERANRLLTSERKQPDAGLFELLVALLWAKNGWQSVELLPEAPPSKTPDIAASDGTETWHIECKRLSKSSAYSEEERAHWLRLWAPLRDAVLNIGVSYIFDIVFHKEIAGFRDRYLADSIPGKLALIDPPCTIIDDANLTVVARLCDMDAARSHLERNYVKYPSPQLVELVGGRRDSSLGFTSIILGKHVRMGDGGGHNRFLASLVFATGAYWACDAPQAIDAKARDVRRHLREAVKQLPSGSPGVVHIGLETLDGWFVEEERYAKIMHSVQRFDARGKTLAGVYCHLFQSYAPPEEDWVVDETVYRFRQYGLDREPLATVGALVPEMSPQDEVHWLRPEP